MDDWLDWVFTPVCRPLDWLVDKVPDSVITMLSASWLFVILIVHGIGGVLLAIAMQWSWNMIILLFQ